MKTEISSQKIGSHQFSRFSTWKSLVQAISYLRYFIQFWQSKQNGQKLFANKHDPHFRKQTERLIIRQVQKELYEKEIENLKDKNLFIRLVLF